MDVVAYRHLIEYHKRALAGLAWAKDRLASAIAAYSLGTSQTATMACRRTDEEITASWHRFWNPSVSQAIVDAKAARDGFTEALAHYEAELGKPAAVEARVEHERLIAEAAAAQEESILRARAAAEARRAEERRRDEESRAEDAKRNAAGFDSMKAAEAKWIEDRAAKARAAEERIQAQVRESQERTAQQERVAREAAAVDKAAQDRQRAHEEEARTRRAERERQTGQVAL